MNASARLLYGLLISRIMVDTLVDFSGYKHVEISSTYDSRTFSSMCYTLVGNQWYKKDSVKERVETVRVTKVSVDYASLLLKDMKDVKARLLTIEDGLKTNIDVEKHHPVVDGLKQGVSTINKLIHQVDNLKARVDFFNTNLTIFVQTSYSNFSRNVEHSYNSCCIMFSTQ
ncbi:hypothetical protein H5410_051056 [Solanum commersonii]|uniref:Uncharacterized protein n=1 Tax=Solanum commersonii TaxID=4109 RepID=A0A9J5WYV2_SOLCO|nr:hypothetical protein H5410_051056 [Solanum commersonii]